MRESYHLGQGAITEAAFGACACAMRSARRCSGRTWLMVKGLSAGPLHELLELSWGNQGTGFRTLPVLIFPKAQDTVDSC